MLSFTPFRQIHLDFHTSEAIPDVGATFDPYDFAAMLERSHVNSITCFARCHHGWLYYPSERFPERIHPQLKREDILREQIEACRGRGIRVCIYLTVQWDNFTAERHPEWRVIDETGRPLGTEPYADGFYRPLCLNSPYSDLILQFIDDAVESLPSPDGFFFDIVHAHDCSCVYCRRDMKAAGLDPSVPSNRRRWGRSVLKRFTARTTARVQNHLAKASIFYNSGHLGVEHRDIADDFTHFEIESLPSGGWGYDHFPVAVRYARTLGRECVGMTGRFHTSWGDFHSLKAKAALEFECYRMLSLNAKCSIGDQLHPSGRLSPWAYDLISSVYAQVKSKEEWCVNATPVTEIAVIHPAAVAGVEDEKSTAAVTGASRMLEELAYQFDIVDSNADLGKYAVLVLPDYVEVSPHLREALNRYLADGGCILASYRSGMGVNDGAVMPAFGVSLAVPTVRDNLGNPVDGKAYPRNHYADYIRPHQSLLVDLPDEEMVMYIRGMEANALPGTTTLADGIAPYFDRTYEHFCSHLQTPSSGRVSYVAAARRGNCIYFTHPLFRTYFMNGAWWYRTLVRNALSLLLPQPLVRHNGPSTMRITINEQQSPRRWVLHLLHYVPERRSQGIDTVVDQLPVHDISLEVRIAERIRNVRTAPQMTELTFGQTGNKLSVRVPRVSGHQMIELNAVQD